MGIFCMVLGVIVFIAFLLVGHCAGTMMLMEGFLGLLGGSASLGISDLLKFPAAENLDRVEYYARKAGSRKNKD